MARTTKTSSSRRKGDEYQDLTALQLALEAYVSACDFKLFVEYERAGSLDDVVLMTPDAVTGYQVKHAVSDHAVYAADDFTNTDSVVFLEKFAASWKKLSNAFPSRQIRLHLRSNRALDAPLAEVVTNEGLFDENFRNNRYRKDKGRLRAAIFKSTALSEDEFRQFLQSFRFDLKHPSWLQLEEHIQANLLDHKLGVSDRRVFAVLKRLVERHAIETADPITPQVIDTLLRETQTRYLLPQSFFVDKGRFVKPPTLDEQINEHLSTADAGYIVVTGPPGSGKSTALTEYCDAIESGSPARFVVVRYYCFCRVNDNHQRLRVEAQSLRTNLLTALQQRFPQVLSSRQFDFSEHRFHEALEAVGRHCGQQKKKLVILLDGLDHVERHEEVRDSVITALPAALPVNVVFLIGTQELHRWTPLALKLGRDHRHIKMPLFSWDETSEYIVTRCGLAVPEKTVRQVFVKSAGLPLHLRYLSEILASADDPTDALEKMPDSVDGDVRSYYGTLWSAFDADGRTDARYLSSVLASLRFSVHEDELMAFQTGIPDAPRFDAAYRHVRHFLRTENSLVSVFHNSFREFVLENTPRATRDSIASDILSRLRQEELESPRWFKHACWYGLEARDYHYVCSRVTRTFVDAAIERFRSTEEITSWIDCAIEAAEATSDLVALCRLGSLKFRTHERLEHTIPWEVLADVLLHGGRVDQVVDSVYSDESRSIIAGEAYTLRIMLTLLDLGREDLATTLFNVYRTAFRGGSSLGVHGHAIQAICFGMLKTRPIKVLKWLARLTIQREILEPEELSVEYAPHLAAYLEGLVRSGRGSVLTRIKKLNRPFTNQLIRQLLIRAVAKWKTREDLRTEVEEYIATYSSDTNLELAFYAAKAGISQGIVNRLAGRFDYPPAAATHNTLVTDLKGHILRFAYWAVVFGYDQNSAIAQQLWFRIGGSEAVWACTQAHLLKVGEVLGSHFADREIDWFGRATEAIEALEVAGDAAGERTPDALDAARFILDRSLRWLGDVIVERCRGRVAEWAALLKRLRSSFIWTRHYGFGEAETNYSFELRILGNQADIPSLRGNLRPVFVDCAKSYGEALSLKGGLRGHHFLTLAAIAARCGFRTDSTLWLNRGIETSLAYGYTKDVTLETLTDVLTRLGKHRPEKVLPGAAAILEMIKWVDNATDGRSTKHFAQHLFPTVVTHNRAAALDLLRTYYEQFAPWQADESVAIYILKRKDGDPEFLWALCGLLNPNESLAPRQHVQSVASSTAIVTSEPWATRLSDYVATMINPRHWPGELSDKISQPHDRPVRDNGFEESIRDDADEKKYTFKGQEITLDEAKQLCHRSFDSMVDTIGLLKEENDYVPDYDLLSALGTHIDNVLEVGELNLIESFVKEIGGWREATYWEQVGRKYLSLGDVVSGLDCVERAIREAPMSNSLTTLIDYDRERAEGVVVRNLAERLQGSAYEGVNAPIVAANLFDLLGKGDALEAVFDNFLHHCQELFAQWPNDRSFDALRNWGNVDCDEDVQIIHLLIDRLGSHSAESSSRLVYSICLLAENRGEKFTSVLEERLASANGLRFWRLLQVVSRLSHSRPLMCRELCHCLLPLLERDDSLVVLVASRAIHRAFAGAELIPDDVEQAIEQIRSRYSSTFSYRGFTIARAMPSVEFVWLIRNAAQAPFHRQLEALCDVLQVDLDSAMAHLERRLLETGTTLEREKDNARSMYSAFAHPQGWPMLGFVSDFHVQISGLLYQTIDELLVKRRYQPQHVEAVWRVIQPVDPEYSFTKLSPMPRDIRPLLVRSRIDWIADEKRKSSVVIADSFTGKWISAFEYRELAHDSPHQRSFVMQTHVRSALVAPEGVKDIESFSHDCWGEKVCTHHPAENLTWQQFREALISGHLREPDGVEGCVPFVSYCHRHVGFLGFHSIANLSSRIIREHNLRLDGLAVFAGEERVAFFEAWQGGYSDEHYNNKPLSFGVRLRVSAQFIMRVCQGIGRAFAIRTIENRFVVKQHQREPEESGSILSICVHPCNIV